MVTVIKKGTTALEINKIVESIKLKSKRKVSLTSLVGSLKLTVDPLKFQKDMRNEWE